MNGLKLKIPVIYDVLCQSEGTETRLYVADFTNTTIKIADENHAQLAFKAKDKDYYRIDDSLYVLHYLNKTWADQNLEPISPENIQSLVDSQAGGSSPYTNFWYYSFNALSSNWDNVKVINKKLGDSGLVDADKLSSSSILASNKDTAKHHADKISAQLAMVNGCLAMKTHMPYYITIGSSAFIKENRKIDENDESCFSPYDLEACMSYIKSRDSSIVGDIAGDERIFPDGLIDII